MFVSLLILPQNAGRFSSSSSRSMRLPGEMVSIVVLCMHTCFLIYSLLNILRVHFTVTTDSKNIEWGNLSGFLLISLISKEAKVYSAESWGCVCVGERNISVIASEHLNCFQPDVTEEVKYKDNLKYWRSLWRIGSCCRKDLMTLKNCHNIATTEKD